MRSLYSLILIFIVLQWSVPVTSSASDEVTYNSLDEAIDAEIDGIDFSDLSGLDDHMICGRHQIDANVMADFVRRFNPDFDEEISRQYVEIGERYGICGDIAFCQAILETGWFRFTGGTAVGSDQHNYCGLGVVKRGMRGAAFPTVADGVRAHIQHLYAYASDERLPQGETLIDPRFSAVSRGVARSWSDLNNRWAMNHLYGSKILKIYDDLKAFADRNNCPDRH